MHKRGVTHHDVKPENVMLHQADGVGLRSKVTVKLGDLGLAAKSSDRSCDFSMYGMTLLCVVTGERFGTRKFRPEDSETFVADVARCIAGTGATESGGDIDRVLTQLPGLLRSIWGGKLEMFEVADFPGFRDWGFFDGEGEEAAEEAPQGGSTETRDGLAAAASHGESARLPFSTPRDPDEDEQPNLTTEKSAPLRKHKVTDAAIKRASLLPQKTVEKYLDGPDEE
jgi:hypothetical protein